MTQRAALGPPSPYSGGSVTSQDIKTLLERHWRERPLHDPLHIARWDVLDRITLIPDGPLQRFLFESEGDDNGRNH